MDLFLSNTIWFFLLGMVTFVELYFAFKKAINREYVIAFYFTVTGFVLLVESILIFVLNAYEYNPQIILYSDFDDSLSGNLFSQSSIAATALVIAVFDLNSLWIVGISFAYGAIEEMFLAHHVYFHHWYKTWYTIVGLILLFLFIRKYYEICRHSKKKLLLYNNVLFSLFTIDIVTILWGFLLSGYQSYPKGIGNTHPYLIAVIYGFVISMSLMFSYYKELRFIYKAAVVLALCIFTLLLNRFGIIYFYNALTYLAFVALYFSCTYYSIKMMDKLYRSSFQILKKA